MYNSCGRCVMIPENCKDLILTVLNSMLGIKYVRGKRKAKVFKIGK